MKVMLAERKMTSAKAGEGKQNGEESNTTTQSNGTIARSNGETAGQIRVPFAEVLKQATVLMLALPLTPSSQDLISEAELSQMRPDAVIVNISRGGIVDERALVAALQERRIYGYGTDVYQIEPAGNEADSVLLGQDLKGLNLVLTPHLAWYGDTTMVNMRGFLKGHVENFAKGSPSPGTVVVAGNLQGLGKC
jgi:lactate dehydrogenase-like 2-hydroxyacid dehydrogenase